MKSLFRPALATIITAGIFLFQACESNHEEPNQSGKAEFKITDAPINDATIKGIYVTIADIQVDGKSIPDFQRRTINLKEYEDGNTAVLGSVVLMAKTHSNMTLVLDTKADDTGNFPGCYVRTVTDDAKYALESQEAVRLVLNEDWTVRPNRTSAVVLDFDVRKAIVTDNSEVRKFSFATQENLQLAIRIINESEAGSVSGTLHRMDTIVSEKVWVYAYQKGSFNSHVEMEPQGDDQIMFANAVTSTELKSGVTGDTFTLDYLPKGEYELYFASYIVNGDATEFNGLIESDISSGATSPDVVSVPAGFPAYVVVMEVPSLGEPARHP